MFPGFTWRRSVSGTQIFLTFDDGPHPLVTPWVLDILKEHHAKATFFVVGDNAKKYPDLIQRIKNEGHSLGNHTFHHLMGWKSKSSAYIQDILACQDLVGDQKMFRPPYGRINVWSIPALSSYDIVMWDVLSKDYRPALNQKRHLKRICRQTRNGSIIVFHDSLKAEHNLRAMLPEYLERMSQRGFQFKAL